jgi:lipoprotein NlpD
MLTSRVYKFSGFLLSVLIALSVAACNSQKKYDYSSSSRSLPKAKYGSIYTVKRGDTLYSIGWAIKQDYKTVAKWNGIRSPYVITPGQGLRMYPPKQKSTAQGKTSYKKSTSTAKTTKKSKSKTSYQSKAPQGKVKRWRWPTVSRSVATRFNPSSGKDGIDIAGKHGDAIYASADGQVVYAGSGLRGFGKLIIIKHNKTYLSAYAHNQSILVAEGQSIKAGKKIGKMGGSGKGSARLHFEIRKNGKPVNPSNYL